MLSRRSLLAGAAALLPLSRLAAADRQLEPWRPGLLDIHHIATGRGDATLIVAPDGTTILIDAGATMRPDPAVLPARPNAQRRPGEWIARYLRRRLADTGRPGLDVLMVTHLHPDHIGAVTEATPPSPSGGYRLTGIADVAAAVPIGRLIDSDWPDYGYPPFEDAVASENYIAFARERAKAGGRVERFAVGSSEQLRLEHGRSAVPFEIRNLAARGEVWTGQGVRSAFPPRDGIPPADRPNVNASSAAIRLGFGDFAYFIAGDLTDWADAGTRPWMDALTPAAEAAGRVDVAVAPHHGMFDAAGSKMVAALAPRIWIISAWHAAHPSLSSLERFYNPRLYAGPREIYATGLSPATELHEGRLTDRFASKEGHIVVRVAADGKSFRVVVTDNRDEEDRVMLQSDPLPC